MLCLSQFTLVRPGPLLSHRDGRARAENSSCLYVGNSKLWLNLEPWWQSTRGSMGLNDHGIVASQGFPCSLLEPVVNCARFDAELECPRASDWEDKGGASTSCRFCGFHIPLVHHCHPGRFPWPLGLAQFGTVHARPALLAQVPPKWLRLNATPSSFPAHVDRYPAPLTLQASRNEFILAKKSLRVLVLYSFSIARAAHSPRPRAIALSASLLSTSARTP